MLEFKDFTINEKNEDIKDTKDSIAIIGLGCRLPKANNPSEFWNILKDGIDCVRPISDQRREDVEDYFLSAGRKLGTFHEAAYLEEIDTFDAAHFNITPKEANLMDPAQRLFLEVCSETFEDAGYGGNCMEGTNTGMFVGYCSDRDYKDMVAVAEPDFLPISLGGNLRPFIGGRIAYIYNLKGPNIMIDTACSSSLIAIHEACNSLRNKECDMAVAGGIQIHIVPFMDVDIGVAAKDGRTKTFDAGSSGTGTGEGVIAMLLKPYDKAIEDGDHIYATIKGSATNHDGRSIGMTAPNPAAQQAVIEKACKNAKVKLDDIEYIEAHGTATKLGDPVEIQGITNAFKSCTQRNGICAIGSVKTNIGHLDGCAGIAGAFKCVLALNKKMIPPSIHFHTPNPLIDFIHSPVYINDMLREWKSNRELRVCGVSSFGITGSNCHIILEEAKNSSDLEKSKKDILLTLSAKDRETLKLIAKNYKEQVCTLTENEVADFCFTANIGRGHYSVRCAIIYHSKEDLLYKLDMVKNCNEDEISSSEVWISDVSNCKEYVDKIESKCSDAGIEVAERYCMGYQINWKKYYLGINRKRVSIPTYPLNHKRHWVNFKKLPRKEYYHEKKWDRVITNDKFEELKEKILVIHHQEKQAINMIAYLRNLGKFVIEACECDDFIGVENKYKIMQNEEGYTKLYNKITDFEIQQVIYFTENQAQLKSIDELDYWVKQELTAFFQFVKVTLNQSSVTRLTLLYCLNEDQNGMMEFESLASICRVSNMESSRLKCNSVCICDSVSENEFINMLQMVGYDKVMMKNNIVYQEKIYELPMQRLEKKRNILRGKVFVVLGGTGGIGQEISKYISKKNHGCIIIWISRGNHKTNFTDTKSQIEATDGILEQYKADISDYKSMQTIIEDVIKRHGKIDVMINCAGNSGTHLICNKDIDEFYSVINPKIYGSFILHKLMKEFDVSSLVLFSSVSSIFGGIGQADYAAANAFMDGLSSKRNVVTLQWSGWKEVGMAAENNTNIDNLFKVLNNKEALEVFDDILQVDINQVMVGKINYEYRLFAENNALKQIFSDEIVANIKDNKICENQVGDKNKSSITKDIINIYREILGFEEIELDKNFFEMGGNSIMVNKMYHMINEIYPDTITVSDIFSYPTIKKLATFICDKVVVTKTAEEEIGNTDDSISDLLKNLKNNSISLKDAIDKYSDMGV